MCAVFGVGGCPNERSLLLRKLNADETSGVKGDLLRDNLPTSAAIASTLSDGVHLARQVSDGADHLLSILFLDRFRPPHHCPLVLKVSEKCEGALVDLEHDPRHYLPPDLLVPVRSF